jgi:hypothetical protein
VLYAVAGDAARPLIFPKCFLSSDHVARSVSAYNQAVTDVGPASRSAILSTDTSADVEWLQIQGCRRMSPLEKARVLSQATRDALTLAESGIRQRHPNASERKCFLRLAALQLGAVLVRQLYPDASQILGAL